MERKMKDYALLTLKGICMGAADVVPGVSGGTIAFIVGIYDELIDSIKSINRESLKMFFTGRWKTFWRMINGNFLFFLLLGIGISIFSLAKLITWLLVAYPILVWALVRGQRYQGMELENRYGICVGSGNRILHNSSYTCRNAFQSVVYFLMRSDSHLCHDSSGYIR